MKHLKSFSTVDGNLIWRTSFGGTPVSFPLTASAIASPRSDPVDFWDVKGAGGRLPVLGGIEVFGTGLATGEAWIIPYRVKDNVGNHFTASLRLRECRHWLEGGGDFGPFEKLLSVGKQIGVSYWASLCADASWATQLPPIGQFYTMLLDDPTVFTAGTIDEIIFRLYG